MNTHDTHGIVRAALLRARWGAKKSGNVLAFSCPRHADRTASAWLGDHAWGCAACGFTESLRSLADHLGVALPEAAPSNGLTVAEYAERKGLTLASLADCGVHETIGKYGEPLVTIPYRDAAGALLRTKYRTRKGTFWGRDGTGTPMYGLDRLATTTGPVLLVEGESDCHAAWQRGVACVGVPGANTFHYESAAHLGSRDVIVWQEPDTGGATLVAAVAKVLPKAKVLREVTFQGQLVKDFGDLHQAVQAAQVPWESVWPALVAKATPIGAEPPAVAFDSITGETLESMLAEKLEPIRAIPTMLPSWNAECRSRGGRRGLARGWMVTIGGRPGYGKTQTALNCAAHAITHGHTVAFVSLEMGRTDLGTSLMAITSGESVAELDQGDMFSVEAFRRAAAFMNDVRQTMGGHALINRKPLHRWRDVDAAVRHLVEYDGAEMVILDYLQLAHIEQARKKEEAIEAASNGFRRLVDDLRVTGIALSQFNRETSKDREHRPQAQGLMGSSSIENDSQQVVLIDHSRHTRMGNLADTWLIVDKNRHGSVFDIPVQWDYRTLRLSERPNVTPAVNTAPRSTPPRARSQPSPPPPTRSWFDRDD